MSNLAVLILMIFFHIVDDYYLQGILASMKQKQWWKKQSNYSDKYENDYIVALFMHSFSWAFMIMLPIAIKLKFELDAFFGIMLLINMAVHCIVDDIKANKMKINLVEDQSIHIIQIILTFILFTSRLNIIIAS